MPKHKALFLDRDGVINIDYGYVYRKDNFSFIDGIFQLTAAAIKHHYKIVIVTNQAGIARGYYTESDFIDLMNWVQEQFQRHGSCISGIYFCPHHPIYGLGIYKKYCGCRKPKPGLILKAAQELDIDLASSVLIGDNESDMQAAMAAGIGKRVLFNKQPQHEEKTFSFIFTNEQMKMGIFPFL